MTELPPFSLTDSQGTEYAFPTGRTTLLCFVKEDCPTCRLTIPLVKATHRWLDGTVDILLIGQDRDGNQRLLQDLDPEVPLLDDSQLRVSFRYTLEMVPTIVLADGAGTLLRSFYGFDVAEWQALLLDLSGFGCLGNPDIDWAALPQSMPGCGSRSLLPGIAERLEAEASGQPLRARTLEIPDGDDPVEYLYARGVTDGLPVVPPTRERVLRMLTGTHRHPQDIVARVPPNLSPVTVEKIAINAVMAGCKPEYLPVVVATVEAICTDEFNLRGVLATTDFVTPIVIVNGPIRDRIAMNYGINALGQGNRANATIGRAIQLIVRNIGGGRPGGVDRATMGQPGKYTFCFAEHEQRSPWGPWHTERGMTPQESAVTVFAGSGPTPIVDKLARTAHSLATSYGLALASVSHPKHYRHGDVLVLIPPEHADIFAADRWTREDIRCRIQESTRRPIRELVPTEDCAEGMDLETASQLGLDALACKFESAAAIHLIVVGGTAGKSAAYIQGWLWGPRGSVMVTRKIEA